MYVLSLAFLMLMQDGNAVPAERLVSQAAALNGTEVVVSGYFVGAEHADYVRLSTTADGRVVLLKIETPPQLIDRPSPESRKLGQLAKPGRAVEVVLTGVFSTDSYYGLGGAFPFTLKLTRVVSVGRATSLARLR